MKTMLKITLVLVLATLCVRWTLSAFGQETTKPAAGGEKPAAKSEVVKETWDWASAMQEVTKKFKGSAGVVMQVGDSTTRNANAQAWGRAFAHKNAEAGHSDSDAKVLTWAHADADSEKNGWSLAGVDVNNDRTATAAKNLTTDGLLKGGPGELPPLKKLLETYKPQVVVLMVGLIDASKKVKPEEAAGNLGKAIDQVLETGAIPVLITLPPDKVCLDEVKAINAKYLALAAEKKIPIIDLYGEVMARQPGEKWVGTLTDKEGRKMSVELAGGPPTEDNLKTGGYLLKSWLVVQKLKEVKAKAIDKK